MSATTQGAPLPRVALAHLPTPVQRPARLAEALGLDVWVKRDDATGGPEAGNKIRKLELLLGEALAQGCDTVLTCGGIQSNHARATAAAAARLGLRAVLYLRLAGLEDDADGAGVPASEALAPSGGNVLLDRMLGAELRLISAESYRRRDELLAAEAARLLRSGARPYVIAEGGSSGLGALGYAAAMAEIGEQLHAGEGGGRPFDLLMCACGSGGTAAGCALGARQHGVAERVLAIAVCEDAAHFETRIAAIMDEGSRLDPSLTATADWSVDDRFRGPAYAVSTPAQRACMVRTARLSGLVTDPVYTGKAMHALWELASRGELRGQRVLWLHTGGLPGLLAESASFVPEL